MPIVNCIIAQRVIEYWNCKMDVPQDVIDEGDKAVEKYIRENDLEVDYMSIDYSDITESMIEIELKKDA